MNNGMMIEVNDLTKRYAGHTAVSRLSFSVGRGEIVGLLGPNGAGKSTTMRVLSCFMPATSGTVRVAGFDVFRDADEVRRRIGYMPENNPLHPEMRVREYLKFRARLKGMSWRRSRERVSVVMDQFGLTEVSRKIVGQLSKGFRQRVGLADALVHEPELIILDEPTIGLDPRQLRAVRDMIRTLGRQCTIMISSHILPELADFCNKVGIIENGRLLVSGDVQAIQSSLGRGRIMRVKVLRELEEAALAALLGRSPRAVYEEAVARSGPGAQAGAPEARAPAATASSSPGRMRDVSRGRPAAD